MSMNNDNRPVPPQMGDGGGKRKRVGLLYILIALVLVAYLVATTQGGIFGPSPDTIATSDFVTAVRDNRVEEVTYKTYDGSLHGKYWREASEVGDDSKLTEFDSTYVGSDSLADLMASHSSITYNVDTSTPGIWTDVLVMLVPTLVIVLVMFFFLRQMQGQNGQALSFGKTKAKTTEETRPKVKFKDVAGIDEAVEELQEVRDFLADPERYHKMGARIPRGVLLVGPPGTGKTLLAKAVAGEAGVPFFSISGSDFVEMFVGVGASRVRDLFKQAKEAAPCIVFIDEIDAVGRQRGAGLGGGHDEREQTLNQLLVEMDGFEANDSVILIAATNRPDILDPALLRPGRFDRQVTVDRPDVAGREQILRVHAQGKPLDDSVRFDELAKLTPGFTGADLANLMNEAALLAARRRLSKIGMPPPPRLKRPWSVLLQVQSARVVSSHQKSAPLLPITRVVMQWLAIFLRIQIQFTRFQSLAVDKRLVIPCSFLKRITSFKHAMVCWIRSPCFWEDVPPKSCSATTSQRARVTILSVQPNWHVKWLRVMV